MPKKQCMICCLPEKNNGAPMLPQPHIYCCRLIELTVYLILSSRRRWVVAQQMLSFYSAIHPSQLFRIKPICLKKQYPPEKALYAIWLVKKIVGLFI
jgi:hypothetical protein